MRFSIDSTSMNISGSYGNSGLIEFTFDKAMNGSIAEFIVKRNTSENEVDLISIEYYFPALSSESTSSFILNILPEHTTDLDIYSDMTTPNIRFVDYVYGLKIYNYENTDCTTQTVIPFNTYSYPKFRIYLDIDNGTHSDDINGANPIFVYNDNYPIVDINIDIDPENQKSVCSTVIAIQDL